MPFGVRIDSTAIIPAAYSPSSDFQEIAPDDNGAAKVP